MKKISRPGLLVIAVLVAGCSEERSNEPIAKAPSQTNTSPQPTQEHFDLAMGFLEQLDDFDPNKGMLQTAYHLNRWGEQPLSTSSWKSDPMIDGLPPILAAAPGLDDLDRSQYTIDDIFLLREAFWMRAIASWVTRSTIELDAGLEPWLDEIEKTKGEPHAYELSVLLQLFDWTVRNIQLDPFVTAGEEVSDVDGSPGFARGEPGPGYLTFPWQTLMYGHGDALARARVFILLARQEEIDVVMLGFANKTGATPPLAWLPAALVDDELYLFDTALGLPIPGPDGVGVASLKQVREDHTLIDSLAVLPTHLYKAAQKDMEDLVAMVDATPEALSRRMQLVEEASRATEPLMLTVRPTDVAARLKEKSAIENSGLWMVPFETIIYRRALARRAASELEIARRLMMEEQIFTGLNPMVQGRQKHFLGKFEKSRDEDGAKSYYFKARVPDSVIDKVLESEEAQQSLGIIRRRENDQEWQIWLQIQQQTARTVKRNCSYWLGLIHYETARWDAAEDWLDTRTIKTGEENPWRNGARYNLARLYEHQGRYEEARQLLLLDESPQKHGNLLRARLLRQRIERDAAP